MNEDSKAIVPKGIYVIPFHKDRLDKLENYKNQVIKLSKDNDNLMDNITRLNREINKLKSLKFLEEYMSFYCISKLSKLNIFQCTILINKGNCLNHNDCKERLKFLNMIRIKGE